MKLLLIFSFFLIYFMLLVTILVRYFAVTNSSDYKFSVFLGCYLGMSLWRLVKFMKESLNDK